jgi:ribosomal protein L7/L12
METKPESIEQMLARLKGEGATPVQAIKAVHLTFNVSLDEAKRQFSMSSAWTKEVASGDKLHDEVFAILEREAKS